MASGVTVAGVIKDILRNPVRHLVLRWNWKSAVTSSFLRGIIYFTTNVSAGLEAAAGAMAAEWIYRTGISGLYGSVTQSFRTARPVWAANLFIMVALPLTSHAIEFLIHYVRGTPRLGPSTIASVCFTAVSTLFNLYAMRRGVLVVDEERRPFADDLKKMPAVIGGFLAAGPVAIWRLAQSRRG